MNIENTQNQIVPFAKRCAAEIGPALAWTGASFLGSYLLCSHFNSNISFSLLDAVVVTGVTYATQKIQEKIPPTKYINGFTGGVMMDYILSKSAYAVSVSRCPFYLTRVVVVQPTIGIVGGIATVVAKIVIR